MKRQLCNCTGSFCSWTLQQCHWSSYVKEKQNVLNQILRQNQGQRPFLHTAISRMLIIVRKKCARNNPDRSTRGHSRRPGGNQSGREKRRDESFQVRAKEPLVTDSHRTISKNSSRCRFLIGHKNRRYTSPEFFSCVSTRRLLSRSRLVWLMHQRNARSQETFSLI